MGRPVVRRVPLKHWSASEAFAFVNLVVHGYLVCMLAAFSWTTYLRASMTSPVLVGSAQMANGHFPLWAYRGHLWVASTNATAEDVAKKGAKTTPHYAAKEQWWWSFVDPSMRGLMEGMDRMILGLKQEHQATWARLTSTQRSKTTSTTKGIGVRDNRYIPQWVKIHVVLRDKGRCVYCGEDDVKLLEFDHREAWSKGGSSKDPLNICLGCRPCNRRKGDRDWGWW